MSLADARTAFVRGDVEAALEALLDVWRRTRRPQIADAIDRVDALSSVQQTRSTPDWLRAAKNAGAVERGRLLNDLGKTSMDLTARLEVIAGWQDPRATMVLVELLQRLPFVGRKTRKVWTYVFETLRALGDARAYPSVVAVSERWKLADDLTQFLRRGIATLDRPVKVGAWSAGDEAELAKLEESIDDRTRKAKSATPDHGDALLAAIYAKPEEDGPRSVYGDWLLEQGDPRGEFIALQLRGDLDVAARKRETKLLKEHGKTWLGSLAPVLIGKPTFRRGFPAAGTIKLRNQGEAMKYAGEPAWHTFEELTWSDHIVADADEPWARYIGPAMSRLREAHGVFARHLLAADEPWALEVVRARCENAATTAAVLGTSLLPRLKKLVIDDFRMTPDWLEAGGGPPEIVVREQGGVNDVAWARAATRLAAEKLVVMHSYYGTARWEFTRDDAGQLTRLAIAMTPRPVTTTPAQTPMVRRMEYVVRALDAGWLTSFEAGLDVDGQLVPVPALEAMAANKLR